MGPILEQLLADVVLGRPGAYQQFKKMRFELKGGCDEWQFISYLSRQTTLCHCNPEALLEAGYIFANNDSLLTVRKREYKEGTIPTEVFLLEHFINLLFIASQVNLGAVGALLEILSIDELSENILSIIGSKVSLLHNLLKVLSKALVYRTNATIPFINYSYGICYLYQFHNLLPQSGMNTALASNQPNPVNTKNLKDFGTPEAIINNSRQALIDQNLKRAFSFISEVSDHLSIAAFQIGCCYKNGVGVAKDIKLACDFFQKAANNNFAPASFALGIIFEEGDYDSIDDFKAAANYSRALIHGSAEAQYRYANFCVKGRGVTRSNDKAIELLNKSRLQGYADANIYLGFLTENGIGITEDIKNAYKLYLLAYNECIDNAVASGAILLLQIKNNFEKIILDVPDNLMLDPNDLDHADLMVKFVNWCVVTKHFNEAIKYYSWILAVFPSHFYTILYRAQLYQYQNRYSECLDDLEKVLPIVDEDDEIDDETASDIASQVMALLDALFDSIQNKPQLLIKYYTTRLYCGDKEYISDYLSRAVMHLRLGNSQQALVDCNFFLGFTPNSIEAYQLRIQIYDRLKNRNAMLADKRMLRQLEKVQKETSSAVSKRNTSRTANPTALSRSSIQNAVDSAAITLVQSDNSKEKECKTPEIPSELKLLLQDFFEIQWENAASPECANPIYNSLVLTVKPAADIIEVLQKFVHKIDKNCKLTFDANHLIELVTKIAIESLNRVLTPANIKQNGTTLIIHCSDELENQFNKTVLKKDLNIKEQVLNLSLPYLCYQYKINVEKVDRLIKNIAALVLKLEFVLKQLQEMLNNHAELINAARSQPNGNTSKEAKKIVDLHDKLLKQAQKIGNELQTLKPAELHDHYEGFLKYQVPTNMIISGQYDNIYSELEKLKRFIKTIEEKNDILCGILEYINCCNYDNLIKNFLQSVKDYILLRQADVSRQASPVVSNVVPENGSPKHSASTIKLSSPTLDRKNAVQSCDQPVLPATAAVPSQIIIKQPERNTHRPVMFSPNGFCYSLFFPQVYNPYNFTGERVLPADNPVSASDFVQEGIEDDIDEDFGEEILRLLTK